MAQRIGEPGADLSREDLFTNGQHCRRFLNAWSQLSESRQRDREWLSTIYLLTVHEDTWNRVSPNVDLALGSIRWTAIKRIAWSNGEKVLIEMAAQCYNGSGSPDWSSLWYTITDAWFDAIQVAMCIRRYGTKVIDWEALRESLSPGPDPAP
jgi:hypothetical protein